MPSSHYMIRLLISSVFLALLIILITPYSSIMPLEAKMNSSILFDVAAGDESFFIGEELQYNVSYSIFDIGLVKLQILDTTTKKGVKIFRAKAHLDSYSGLPFVDLHQVFFSEMDREAFSQLFVSHDTSIPEKMPYSRYTFDYNKNTVFVEVGTDPGRIITKSDEVAIVEKQLDGLSLFYYARRNLKQVKKISVPVMVGDKTNKTHFNFMNKIGSTKIDAVTYPVQTVEFDGTSEFTGVFGLTGYFRGFFSNDEAAIPIVAKMKVILGSVHIELIKWTRPGWIPPQANE